MLMEKLVMRIEIDGKLEDILVDKNRLARFIEREKIIQNTDKKIVEYLDNIDFEKNHDSKRH